jgi:hypothetical protein
MNMDTMDPAAGNDWLEQALRADGLEHRSTYIGEDGFAARVMAGLPRQTTLPVWRRPAIALLWLCAGIAAVFAVPGMFDEVFRGAVALLVGHRLGVADIVALFVIPSTAACGMLIYAAQVE